MAGLIASGPLLFIAGVFVGHFWGGFIADWLWQTVKHFAVGLYKTTKDKITAIFKKPA